MEIRATQALGLPAFRRLWTAQILSGIGNWLDYLALVVLITYSWRLGATGLASLSVALAVPFVLIAPIAGVFADRLPPRWTMVASDLFRAAMVALYAFAPNLTVLCALVFLKTTASTLFVPAEQRTIKTLVPERHRTAALSLIQMTNQLTKILGPALGGAIIAFGSVRLAFFIDALSFVLSAAVLSGASLRVPHRRPRETAETTHSVWSEFREGLSFIRRTPALRSAITALSATMLIVFTFDALGALAFQALGFDAGQLGLAMACISAGVILGTLCLSQWGDRLSHLGLLGMAQLSSGVLIGGIGLAVARQVGAPLVVWAGILAVFGFTSAGVIVAMPLIMQSATPEHMMGRVSAAAYSVPAVMQMVAPPIGAALVPLLGVGELFALGGFALGALGVVILLVTRSRHGVADTTAPPRHTPAPDEEPT